MSRYNMQVLYYFMSPYESFITPFMCVKNMHVQCHGDVHAFLYLLFKHQSAYPDNGQRYANAYGRYHASLYER